MTRKQIFFLAPIWTMVFTAAFWGIYASFAGGIPVQEIVLWKIGSEGQETNVSLFIHRGFDILTYGLFPLFLLPMIWRWKDTANHLDAFEKLVAVLLLPGLVIPLTMITTKGWAIFPPLVSLLASGILGSLLIVALYACDKVDKKTLLVTLSALAIVVALAFGGVVGACLLLPPFLIALMAYGAILIYRKHVLREDVHEQARMRIAS